MPARAVVSERTLYDAVNKEKVAQIQYPGMGNNLLTRSRGVAEKTKTFWSEAPYVAIYSNWIVVFAIEVRHGSAH